MSHFLPLLFGIITPCFLLQAQPAARTPSSAVRLRYVAEPRENAFQILVPAGWTTQGGIVRVDPTAAGGAGNSIAAKVDFTIKRDNQGSVMIRFLPDMAYMDLRGSPAGNMGLFPPGSNYNGMTVMPKMDAQTFLSRVVFPQVHSRAGGVQVLDRRPLPQLAHNYQQRVAAMGIPIQFRYDAATMTVTYQEGGAAYKEALFAVVEDWGAAGAGMWTNKETFYFRAPPAEFARWVAVVGAMHRSVKINPQWLAREIQGQQIRAKIASDTQRYIQKLDQEIVEHRRMTNAEINNDMFLTLMGQEEYINPHTRQVEVGTNQWKHRWVNGGGEEIYTDDPYYDPNLEPGATRTDWKRSPVRPRRP